MKKYIIASIISIFPVFVLGLCLPIATVLNSKKDNYNETFFWVCALILTIGISTLLTTMLLLVRYANSIDKLDDAETLAYEKKQELDKLIRTYNSMILRRK